MSEERDWREPLSPEDRARWETRFVKIGNLIAELFESIFSLIQ